MSKTDSELLNYLAGIVDGEGCIGGYSRWHSRRSFSVSVHVCMTNSIIPSMFVDRFGGHVLLEKKKTTAGKPIFRWSAFCNKAADVLEILVPYLVLKKDQAIDAITLARLHSKSAVKKLIPTGSGRRGLISLPVSDEMFQKRLEIANRLKERNI